MRILRSRPGRVLYRAIATTLLAGFACGCARTSAPPGFLPSKKGASKDPYGAWIDIRHHAPEDVRTHFRTRGELIAAEAESVHVLTDAGWRTIPITDIDKATLTLYSSGAHWQALWGILGFLSTASHGFYLAISAPVWLGTAITTTAIATREPRIVLHARKERSSTEDTQTSANPALWDDDWNGIRRYARFPQGPPPEIDRTALPMKPLPPLPRRKSSRDARGISH